MNIRTTPEPRTPGLFRGAARAFSMIEIVLVIAIIGMLMAVAAYNFLGQGNRARIATSKMSMRTIEGAVKQYNLDKGVFPPSLAALTTGATPYLEPNKMKDAWRHDFYYQSPGPNGKPYDLYSAGVDGEAGTSDDIDVWSMDDEH